MESVRLVYAQARRYKRSAVRGGAVWCVLVGLVLAACETADAREWVEEDFGQLPVAVYTFEPEGDEPGRRRTVIGSLSSHTPTTGDTFYDIGGPDGQYENSLFQEWTFCPDNPGDLVTLNFLSVEVESCCDELAIYDGGTASENNILEADLEGPAVFTSTSSDGCLTVTFDQDGSVIRDGWEALII